MIALGTTAESSLLLTLEEISRLVAHSHDPAETLANIVRLIQGRIQTDVCSVYLLEPERGELVLGATLGLASEGVGRIRMGVDEGLTGLVAQTMAPVMVDEAVSHPRFKYFPEAGEDPYHSFLGVPLIEAGTVLGVLVVQTVEPRVFSPDEIRMLVTVSSQLAPLVSEARVLEHLAEAAQAVEEAAPTAPLKGAPLSPGQGLGRAYLINGGSTGPVAEPESRPPPDRDAELDRLTRAVADAREEITRLGRRISDLVGEDYGAILQAQFMILQDRSIERDLTAALVAGSTAEAAVSRVLDKYVAIFQKMANPLFRERAYDVKDVFRRVLWHLKPRPAVADSAGGERLVLVGPEASILDLFSVEPDRLAAVVVGHGGPQSHAAILARSLGVPMVGQVADLPGRLWPGRLVRVDGSTGRIELDPVLEAAFEVEPAATDSRVHPRDIETVQEFPRPDLPRVEVNINLLGEVARAVALGASGVGLYRTEFLFLARRTLPTEEEQLGVYRKLLAALQGRPASIRTFDLRPDKVAHLHAATDSPLDWRRVLDSPPIQRLFKDQVRAILRAAASGPARILVPQVTRTEQLDFVVETIDQARHELRREGLEHGDTVPLGIMIELTAALPLMGAWADRVDFFALGTNDLVASALGLDRDNPLNSGESDPLHPGFLRLVSDGLAAAHQANRPVGVCGEMAANPTALLALTALGVDMVSVAVGHLVSIRQTLANWPEESSLDLASHLPHLQTADQVRDLLRETQGGKASLLSV